MVEPTMVFCRSLPTPNLPTGLLYACRSMFEWRVISLEENSPCSQELLRPVSRSTPFRHRKRHEYAATYEATPARYTCTRVCPKTMISGPSNTPPFCLLLFHFYFLLFTFLQAIPHPSRSEGTLCLVKHLNYIKNSRAGGEKRVSIRSGRVIRVG